MSIWKKHHTVEELNSGARNTLSEHVGIEITEVGDDYVKGTMPVDRRTHQPLGMLHGGASVVLAETIGSIAGFLAADKGYYCLGLDINANHLSPATEGYVTGIASPIHIGRRTHVWEIRISSEAGKLVCISRLTLSIMEM